MFSDIEQYCTRHCRLQRCLRPVLLGCPHLPTFSLILHDSHSHRRLIRCRLHRPRTDISHRCGTCQSCPSRTVWLGIATEYRIPTTHLLESHLDILLPWGVRGRVMGELWKLVEVDLGCGHAGGNTGTSSAGYSFRLLIC